MSNYHFLFKMMVVRVGLRAVANHSVLRKYSLGLSVFTCCFSLAPRKARCAAVAPCGGAECRLASGID